ncbi:MAG: alpha/beta fold hydrolase [Actinomycetota bacterium]
MTRVVLLHDLGDPGGGAPWAEAMTAAGVVDVVAPDLPGHGSADPPVGGNYVRADAGYLLAGLLGDGLVLKDAVLVGVGHSGWVATVAAVGGHVGGVALIAGLGRPWRSVDDRLARRRRRTRELLADDAAMAVHEGPGADPRLRYVLEPHGDQALAIEAAALVTVPTLVVEPDLDAATLEVAAAFGGPVTLAETDTERSSAAREVAAWLATAPI